MANKKFYYKNKNKKAAVVDYSQLKSAYSGEQLNATLSSLGISESTQALLEKNNIKTAGDLIVRSEKDMYRVQGLSKKILLEVKSALAKNGMSLRVDSDAQSGNKNDVPKKQEIEQNKRQDKKTDAEAGKNQPRDAAKKQGVESRFGLADRRVKQAPSERPQAKKAKQERLENVEIVERPVADKKREKLAEPLPQEEWRKVMKGGKWGFSDGFKTVIPPMYDEVSSFRGGLASVELNEKCGYIDGENNVVIPFDYDIAMNFSEGFAMVCKGDKCGYINAQGEVVIPLAYDAATRFENGEAKVKKDGRWATIKPDGTLVWII